MIEVVALVPAMNSRDTVGATVRALTELGGLSEVVVIDDGSTDDTASVAAAAGATVVLLKRNVGKGGAVAAGVAHRPGADHYLLIDADLGTSAAHAYAIVSPVVDGVAVMSIATFPSTGRSRGFGLVKRAAGAILCGATGRSFAEPLSGQRAVRGESLRSVELAPKFGLEVGLTLDVAARGDEIVEVPVAFEHRATGRGLAGVTHRARQGRDMLIATANRHGWSQTLRWAVPSLWRRSSP